MTMRVTCSASIRMRTMSTRRLTCAGNTAMFLLSVLAVPDPGVQFSLSFLEVVYAICPVGACRQYMYARA